MRQFLPYAPRIVRVSCDGLRVLVKDGDDIALQVFDEIIRYIVVGNAANIVLIIVKRNQCITAPHFTENLVAVQYVGVLHAVYGFTRPDSVCIIGIGITVKGFELPSLFPSQGVTEVLHRVALSLLYLKCQRLSI